MKFEQTVQKLYKKRHLWRQSWIFAFCAFLAKYLQGCPPRLCSWVYVDMIFTGQPFTARYVPQTLLAPWVEIIKLFIMTVDPIT